MSAWLREARDWAEGALAMLHVWLFDRDLWRELHGSDDGG